MLEEPETLTNFGKSLFNKYKIFIYVAGGVTAGEVAAVGAILEAEWGRLGVFNRGVEREWDVEFYLLSDCEMTAEAYLDAMQ